MSSEAKPAYLRGRGSRGRGTPHPPATGDRGIQRPGRQKNERRNQEAPSTYSSFSQDSATSDSNLRGNSAHILKFKSGILKDPNSAIS